jgi:hypothetical protein
MKVKITRLPFDTAGLYLVDTGGSDGSGMEASGLKAWLLGLGVENSAVSAILNMSPNQTMSVQVADKAA